MSNQHDVTVMPSRQTAADDRQLPAGVMTDTVKTDAGKTDTVMTDTGAGIEYGLSGKLLYLLEQHAFSGETSLLDQAGEIAARLISYCETSSTRDYSLYKGRCGIVYAIIQYYSFTRDPSLIRRCKDIMRPATGDYLQSRWTSDYLYDGRSGTLLVLWMLYQVAGDAEELRHAMQLFLEKIIANAHLSPEGLYWAKDAELNPCQSCGMAFGTAGILYVLMRIAGKEPDPAFRWIIDQAGLPLTGSWDGSKMGWGNHSKKIESALQIAKYKTAFIAGDDTVFEPVYELGWAAGAAGIAGALFPSLHGEQVALAVGRLVEEFAGMDGNDVSLFSGTAGIGLILREAGRAVDIAHFIGEGADDDGGLLHGRLGLAYLSTRVKNPGSPLCSILRPGLPAGLAEMGAYRYSLDPGAIGKRILSVNYPRTVELLEAINPTGWQSLESQVSAESSDSLFEWFGKQVRDSGKLQLPSGIHDRLQDIFQLEKAKAGWQWEVESKLQRHFISGLVYRERTLAQLNRSDSWLRERSLIISPRVRMLTSRWDWGCKGDHKVEYHKGIATYHLGNLHKPARRYEYLIQYTPGSGVEECYLKPDTLMLLHQFDHSRRVDAALENICRYIGSMPDEMLKQLLEGLSEFVDVARFRKHIVSDILFQLRQWIYRDVLVIQE